MPTFGPSAKIDLTYDGFLPGEMLKFEGHGYQDVFSKVGVALKPQTEYILEAELEGKDYMQARRKFALARSMLEKMRALVNKDYFVVEGVNYLSRYLDAFSGFATGSGCSLEEIAFLQIDTEVGCQSLLVQDRYSGVIRLAHSEENGVDTDLKSGRYHYRLVEINTEDRQIVYFAYPGLVGFGPAFGININKETVQVVDDLYARVSLEMGVLWVSALSFMALDLGSEKLPRLIEKLQTLPTPRFCGAYAIHQVNAKDLKMVSLEVGGDLIDFVGSSVYPDRFVIAQANYPRDIRHESISASCQPPPGSDWTEEDAFLYVEMSRRQRRLELLGQYVRWLSKNPHQSLELGTRILADPYGDLETSYAADGGYEYAHTGWASVWTAGFITAYFSPAVVKIIIGRMTPDLMVETGYIKALSDQKLALGDIDILAKVALKDFKLFDKT